MSLQSSQSRAQGHLAVIATRLPCDCSPFLGQGIPGEDVTEVYVSAYLERVVHSERGKLLALRRPRGCWPRLRLSCP